MTSATPAIRLTGLTKTFGSVNAVDQLDLEIGEGEFFSMLGPSGSGKTTVLRLIAGFELPTSGTVELQGVDVTHRAPFDRDVNTVFQDYALFPHMTVLENVAYGLRVRGVGRAERAERAEAHAQEAIKTVADPGAQAEVDAFLADTFSVGRMGVRFTYDKRDDLTWPTQGYVLTSGLHGHGTNLVVTYVTSDGKLAITITSRSSMISCLRWVPILVLFKA